MRIGDMATGHRQRGDMSSHRQRGDMSSHRASNNRPGDK
jgi:hypothetical protein